MDGTHQRFAFRVDASLEIGSGHVMRCLTLADALRRAGQGCQFVCRALDGDLRHLITERGYPLSTLPAPVQSGDEIDGYDPAYSQWAGVPWQVDAKETRTALLQISPDWVILDHYAFDGRWRSAALSNQIKLLVLDDLANRRIDADIVLDANFGKSAEDYRGLVPPTCEVLAGTAYCLLRSEFADSRAEALVRRATVNTPRTVLISMGGVDLPDATSRILENLAQLPFAPELSVTAVMSANAPALGRVQHVAATLPLDCTVRIGVSDMATLMGKSDLAIGAVGGTTWERCALGLPTLMLTIAENQIPAAQALHQARAATYLGNIADDGWPGALLTALTELYQSDALAGISEISAAICDGDGAERVVARLIGPDLTHRDATRSDSRRVWDWRYSGDEHLFDRSGEKPTFGAHDAWFIDALKAPDRVFRILTFGNLPIGYVRLDLSGSSTATVSICLSPHHRGQGLARRSLAVAHEIASAHNISSIVAEVHQDNLASLHLFTAMGYAEFERDDLFLRLRLKQDGAT